MKKATQQGLVLFVVGLGVGIALGLALGGASAPATAVGMPSEIDRTVFAASIIVVPVGGNYKAAAARETAERAYEELVAGADFATVARSTSRDPTAGEGGFQGFVDIGGDSMFAGALQALRPGQFSLPILTADGYQIVKRHSFEEARALEAKVTIPAYGVFVKWESLPEGLEGVTQDDARALAEKLVADLEAGRTTIAQAAVRYTPAGQRHPEAYLGRLMDRPNSAQAFAALSKVAPGGVVGPIQEPHGFAVLVRGHGLRAVVRQILIQHMGTAERDIRISRTREEALKLAKKVLADVRADPTTWNSAVERFSDDRKNLTNGGSLGAINVAELPEALRAVLIDMPVGTIHPEPIETPQGIHIVWRVR